MSSINNLSVAQLRRAASLKERIEKLQSKLNGLLGSATSTTKTPTASATSSGPVPKKRRRMSAEGRARIAAAARARWAKVRAAQK